MCRLFTVILLIRKPLLYFWWSVLRLQRHVKSSSSCLSTHLIGEIRHHKHGAEGEAAHVSPPLHVEPETPRSEDMVPDRQPGYISSTEPVSKWTHFPHCPGDTSKTRRSSMSGEILPCPQNIAYQMWITLQLHADLWKQLDETFQFNNFI